MSAEIPDGAVLVARGIVNSSLWTMRPEDRVVAITCISIANWKDKDWFDGKKRITVKRGQFVRSLKEMSEAAHLSIQKVRTSLEHLKNDGFLTQHPTKRYTVYTIPKYDFYQRITNYSDSANTEPNTEPTQAQHTPNMAPIALISRCSNTERTSINNILKEEGKESKPCATLSPEEIQWERDRVAAAEIRMILSLSQGLDTIINNLKAARLRGKVTNEQILDLARAQKKDFEGHPIWTFLESNWPTYKPEARKKPETEQERIKRLAGL